MTSASRPGKTFVVTGGSDGIGLECASQLAKSETDEPTTLKGWTIEQDADDPAVFAPLIAAGGE